MLTIRPPFLRIAAAFCVTVNVGEIYAHHVFEISMDIFIVRSPIAAGIVDENIQPWRSCISFIMASTCVGCVVALNHQRHTGSLAHWWHRSYFVPARRPHNSPRIARRVGHHLDHLRANPARAPVTARPFR
jgi:hypothetical protein